MNDVVGVVGAHVCVVTVVDVELISANIVDDRTAGVDVKWTLGGHWRGKGKNGRQAQVDSISIWFRT